MSGALPRDSVEYLGVMWKDSFVLRLTHGTSKAWEGCISLDTYPNEASEVLIGIYAKNRCRWSGRLMKSSLENEVMLV